MLDAAGAQATHVPYKGASELVNAVIGDQVSFGYADLLGRLPQSRPAS